MNRITAFEKITRVKWMIEHKTTGNPKQLAQSLEVSERTVYRIIQNIQDMHRIEVEYSYSENSYVIIKK